MDFDCKANDKKDISGINSIANIQKIKSKYILKKIFNNLHKSKSFTIIKYNKKVQNKLDISVNDYKIYYNEIEIEIVPAKNKFENFINIQNKKEEIYFHIYFNDSKEEIKRNYLKENEEVKKIRILIDYNIYSFKGLFSGCRCLESINFKRFYRNNINDMSEMFEGCSSLKNVNLSKFKTENTINMNNMFSRCSSLKELNLSDFNTSKVINMSGMFSGCSSLKKLNISNFDTKMVNDMSHMFSRCSSLKFLDLSNFNTDNVKDMSYMFSECATMRELDLSSFNTKNVTNFIGMFCNSSYRLQKKKIRPDYDDIMDVDSDYEF